MTENNSRVITFRSDDLTDEIIEVLLSKGVSKNQSDLIKKGLMALAKKELKRSELIALLANAQNRKINRIMAMNLDIDDVLEEEESDSEHSDR